MKKLVLLMAVLAGLSGTLSSTARAFSLSIAIGDQPFYVHGPGYWAGGIYYVWVPGHYNRNHDWVHGHYKVR